MTPALLWPPSYKHGRVPRVQGTFNVDSAKPLSMTIEFPKASLGSITSDNS
jgi:hypothetical protein